MSSIDKLLNMFRKKEPIIEYVRFACIEFDGLAQIYKITKWDSEDYFRTEYGSYLWDSRKEMLGPIISKTKDKIIRSKFCIYDLDNKDAQRSRS